jgi:hypothetical protein
VGDTTEKAGRERREWYVVSWHLRKRRIETVDVVALTAPARAWLPVSDISCIMTVSGDASSGL